MAQQISKIQSGFVYHYAFVMLLGLTRFISVIYNTLKMNHVIRVYFLSLVSFVLLAC
ncbi:hypothetical protein Mp_8g03540 [Marchantia polymorpha subsp. ruderalis]|uniref:Uncharacterized protein n=1 Tax=Marchantia polymorpha TaxID=3197 RepID=A0A2R6XJI1_MARPO|nr:hypothetical protein MARPO_0012s0144 [Marchantia polymorpha]BBN18569.1 hypothetical protein Mp_8g03540 [Marchantia polymorpha subsp. ruderalis]|eukprot:PTQ46216.1 hypothetical protein MARPO_0012s0144 [Marchantia polymorpha]